jgi:hypothetical protein
MTSNQKKAKISNGDEDFASVREYLMKHELGPKHPAIAAALRGLDDELKRQERDRKLQAKFNNTTEAANSHPSTTETDDFSRVERLVPFVAGGNENMNDESSIPPAASSSMTDDWHDVAKDNDADFMTDSDEYGTLLAQRAVQAMVEHSVVCRTALGVVTVALHATLLDRGFVCTGIPPQIPASGFAPPVREIKQFLPLDWESSASSNGSGLKLRYRKICAIELHTVLDSTQSSLTISLGDVSMTVECLEDHVNLKSWSKATQNGTKLASPTLHYKALAKLLGDFAQRFDLGDVNPQEQSMQNTAPREQQVPPFHQVPEDVPRRFISSGRVASSDDPTDMGHDPLRMPTQPSRSFSVGAGDLLPTGLLQYPHGGMPGTSFPNQGGNLVGPDHPMFRGGSGAFAGNGMMQPRYDPIGPPGGPTELDPATNPMFIGGIPGRVPPGGTGVPNNDLAKQPRFGNNNMFH